jgi:tRNA(Arg) A34 adenosine deaminase TadA
MSRHRIVVDVPAWLDDWLDEPPTVLDRDNRMQTAISLARRNVDHATGGPFGAVVVEDATGRVVGAGVNLVLPTGDCTAHAEMIAIELAEQVVGRYDLAADEDRRFELVSSAEPCAMCLGAIVWSGVRGVVCGARDADARAIGFDEGPKRADWEDQLRCRDIEVVRDVLRDEAVAVLQDYARGGGAIYSPRR